MQSTFFLSAFDFRCDFLVGGNLSSVSIVQIGEIEESDGQLMASQQLFTVQLTDETNAVVYLFG